MKLSVKKGDNVKVLAGKDAKKTGEVLEVLRDEGKVVVAGVNIQSHHKKPRTKDDKGGIIKSEGAIDVSNVQVVCPVCKKATRVGHKLVNGKSVRVCKHADCGAELDVKGAKKSTKAAAPKTEKPAKATAPKAEKTEKTAAVKAEKAPKAETTATKTKKTASSSKKA